MNPIARQKTDNLTEIGKLQVYLHYFSTMVTLKHDFEVIKKGSFGYSTPPIIVGDIGILHLWKNVPIMTFKEFCFSCISDWYWKHEKDFHGIM